MKKILPIILLALLLGTIARFLIPDAPVQEPSACQGRMKIHFIDVGQGDCTLLQTPDNRNILVDAGGKDTAEDVVQYLKRQGVSRIDLLVITHPHDDHIGGLPRVLEEFGVSMVVDTGSPHGSETYRKILENIDARRIDYRLAKEWPSLQISRCISFDIIWPPEGYAPDGNDALNNSSIVIRVKYGETSLLLAGDIQSEAEDFLLADRQDFQSTILKVAHHGSDDSTSNEFLQVVQPEYAVVSVGIDNPYGHPSSALLRRLYATGAHVYRTDHNGTVVFTTDGKNMQVAAER